MKKPQWIVTDIEGTTTSISFVHEVLFPYARQRMGEFLLNKSHEPDVSELVAKLKTRMNLFSLEEVVTLLDGWMADDRKETELKALQGILWRNGYEEGDFTGHVYPDVAPALVRWREADIKLAVYSSGSIAAQKLLFARSDVGDLDQYFSANFDTTVGHKRESASYQAIVDELGTVAADILFLSDVGAELEAAQMVGMKVIQLMRDGNKRDERFELVETFEDLDRLWS